MKSSSHLLLMPPNWIGDVIMAQPALRTISEFYTQHAATEQISVCGRAWLKDLLPYLGLPHSQYQSAIPAADTALLFPNSFRSAWMCRRAGVNNIIGYRGQWRSLLLSQALPRRVDTLHEHHRDFHLDIARQLNIPVSNSEVTLSPPTGAKTAGQNIMLQHGLNPDRVICIAPGAQFGTAKCYPPEGFHSVVKQLSDAGWQPLVLGMPEDHDVGQNILNGINAAHWNAAGTTSLSEALQLISACNLMLCNDSGLMHVAAAVGVKACVIYGSSTPAYTPPLTENATIFYKALDCSPCFDRQCRYQHYRCLKSIEPYEVIEKIVAE